MNVRSSLTIPAREGRALPVKKGERLKLSTPKGQQAVDFFAYEDGNLDAWLSATHTWMSTGSLRPREGDTFLTRFRSPIMKFVEDGAGGVHDMLLAACDEIRYREYGIEGRPGCGDNLITAMAALGHRVDVVPQPINFFTNTEVGADLALGGGPNPVPPGGYVVVEALVDVICAASACPWDRTEPWVVNSPAGPSEIEATVLAP
ncbi:MAG: uncharacterized protein QOH58_1153 [Thermoleophilaceae bacterium]|jgi:uncharacterized protein YcgI (DUF1989 family)|nr:uncharacterized protein [Thermoleophilaceae bacterium]